MDEHIKKMLEKYDITEVKKRVNSLIDKIHKEMQPVLTELPDDIGVLVSRHLTPVAIKRYTAASKQVPGRELVIKSLKNTDAIINWIMFI